MYDGDGDGEEMARRIVAAYRAVAEGGGGGMHSGLRVKGSGFRV